MPTERKRENCFLKAKRERGDSDKNGYYYYRTYREKRNKIIKFFRAPYMVLDSYKFLQIPTVT